VAATVSDNQFENSFQQNNPSVFNDQGDSIGTTNIHSKANNSKQNSVNQSIQSPTYLKKKKIMGL